MSYEFATLGAFPELVSQANALVEEAFAYQKPHQFVVDFAPLAGPRHSHERFVLIDPQGPRVVAHVGTRIRDFVWQGKTIPVAMLGGIAVEPALQGQGLFQALFNRVLSSLQSQCALFLLWSDKHELYQKWDFYLAGKQWCYRTTEAPKEIATKKLKNLPREEKENIASLYRQVINLQCFSPLRDETDWDELAEITSAELILMREGYAFRGKGMDLSNVLHDFAHRYGVNGVLRELGDAGVIWSAQNEQVGDEVLQELQQVGLWRPNTHPMALRKLSHLLGHELHFRDGQFVVEGEGYRYRMNAEELLGEIFNYGKHGLRKDAVPVYVGGLDSV